MAGAASAALLDQEKIREAWAGEKNPISEGKHNHNEYKSNQKARGEFAKPIRAVLDEKLKKAKDIKAKKEAYFEAAEKMKGFKDKTTPYQERIKGSLGTRAIKIGRVLKGSAKIGGAVAGLAALSEYGNGWNRTVEQG